jgi:mono/diheme cytochrome c family protein
MLDRRYWIPLAAALAAAACADRGGTAAGGAASAQEGEEVRLRPVGTLPPGVSTEAGEKGRDVYERTCVMCHGEQGEGTRLGPSLTDAEWLGGRTGSFEEIASVVRDGAVPDSTRYPAPMHPRGDGSLTEDEVRSVAAYTYSIAHPR